MTLRTWLRDRLQARGYLWFRRPDLPWGLELEADLARWFDLPSFSCVVDVGAHLGETSLRFARLCPNARVFAFEMMPGTFEQLRHNVREIDRIRPLCAGLFDEAGRTTVVEASDSQQNSLLQRAGQASRGNSVEVELRRLDEMAPGLGIDAIDLLKVDAEGCDLQVMKGATALFEAGRVRAVLVEVDFGHSSLQHGNFVEIASWLERWALRPVAFYDTQVLQRRGAPYLDYTNALFVREP